MLFTGSAKDACLSCVPVRVLLLYVMTVYFMCTYAHVLCLLKMNKEIHAETVYLVLPL